MIGDPYEHISRALREYETTILNEMYKFEVPDRDTMCDLCEDPCTKVALWTCVMSHYCSSPGYACREHRDMFDESCEMFTWECTTCGKESKFVRWEKVR